LQKGAVTEENNENSQDLTLGIECEVGIVTA
jgi:hypothetical protein